MEFTQEIDTYIVLKLHLLHYKGTHKKLDKGFQIAGYEIRPKVRKREEQLLKLYFKNWEAPYLGKLFGWREDSPLYVLYNNNLIAGVYLCEKNEFNEGNRWGQLHYAFIDPSFKGRGIYSVLFKDAVDLAKSWKLNGLILNSDRYILPDVYIKWGAIPWKKIPKHRSSKGVKYILFGVYKKLKRIMLYTISKWIRNTF